MTIDYQTDLKKIKDLAVGNHAYVFWFEESGGHVVCVSESPRIYELYEIGLYGGNEAFVDLYQEGEEEEMLDRVYTWT
jgi:hypothetical protein